MEKQIDNICDKWHKLIDEHKKSLKQCIKNIKQKEINKNKLINKKLNDELHLIQKTKEKCQKLISYTSINDIWKPKESNSNDNNSKENIISLVTNCVEKLDKSLQIPETTIFDQLQFNKFDKQQVQELLKANIAATQKNPTRLSVNVVKMDKVTV